MKRSAVSALEMALRESVPDTVDPGYKTREQWAEMWNVCQSRAREKIREHIRSGKMTAKPFFVLTACGARHKTPFYKAV